MTSNVTSRETVRDAVATLLSTAMVGTGLLAQAVYNYQVDDFAEQSPVIVVSSGPAHRGRLDSQELGDTAFAIDIHVFVLYSLAGGTWTELQSEDSLDALEKKVIDTLVDGFDAQPWLFLDTPDWSVIQPVMIGENEYRRETITVVVGTR